MVVQFDCAFDLAIDDQIFATGDLTLDRHRLPYAGGASGGFSF
jgi:hypothetical protein